MSALLTPAQSAYIRMGRRISNLKRKLDEATKALDWIKLRSQMEGTPNPFAEKIADVAGDALQYIRET